MFPNFNIYSTPLLILVIQGLILVCMLLLKAKRLQDISSLILAVLLLVTCYHRTTYTIGFLGWYDTFRNTKINYYLIPLVLSIGPLILFYIKSIGVKDFRMTKWNYFHFAPLFLFVIYRLILLIYDSNQDGYAETQNGILMQRGIEHLGELFNIIFAVHLFIYLVLSFISYYQIRRHLENHFSNTYKFELKWLRNFLVVFSVLFVYDVIQFFIESVVVDLHWTEEWWFQFFSLLVVLYVGIKGYFTPIENLPLLDADIFADNILKGENASKSELQKQIVVIRNTIEKDQLYLDPNLSLTKLAHASNLAPSQLSLAINKGLNRNFNEFINAYRVSIVKQNLQDEKFSHLSILAIAFDAGFNSKATFNRVFKKIDGNPPSFYRKRK